MAPKAIAARYTPQDEKPNNRAPMNANDLTARQRLECATPPSVQRLSLSIDLQRHDQQQDISTCGNYRTFLLVVDTGRISPMLGLLAPPRWAMISAAV